MIIMMLERIIPLTQSVLKLGPPDTLNILYKNKVYKNMRLKIAKYLE